jgi:hypothetical protein
MLSMNKSCKTIVAEGVTIDTINIIRLKNQAIQQDMNKCMLQTNLVTAILVFFVPTCKCEVASPFIGRKSEV